VSVDLDLCQGHGVCESEAPEVFHVDTASNKVVLLDPQPPDDQRGGVAAAAANCPTRAIRTAGSNKKTASDPLS
jgi:ferredoxin